MRHWVARCCCAIGEDGAERKIIDTYLQRWRADSDSPYFQTLRHWGIESDRKAVPAIFWWAIGVLAAALLLMLVFSHLLRRQVTEKPAA